MRRKPKRGTKPALPMAARRSRIRLASAQMALISLIFVTPMATSSSGLPGKLSDLIGQQKTEEGRRFGTVFRSGGRRRSCNKIARPLAVVAPAKAGAQGK